MLQEKTVTIQKLVHGGQGLAQLDDGRKVFVWNALPGEVLKIKIIKNKKDYAEAITAEVIKPSKDRIIPSEPDSYLATSPWQIMSLKAENTYKAKILSESFAREGLDAGTDLAMVTDNIGVSYRNKMEFGFWGDDSGISAAHFVRGSHGKTKVSSSILALEPINIALRDLVKLLNQVQGLRASNLKSVILRCNQNQKCVAALFVKSDKFTKLSLSSSLQGLVVYHSNPRSPASVPTKVIYEIGDRTLTDKIDGKIIKYDVLSFFQVNLPVFMSALSQIKQAATGQQNIIDLYSGVGTIGLCVVGCNKLIELDKQNINMAMANAKNSGVDVIHASAEKALEYITPGSCIIVDPPRSGLHIDVVKQIILAKPAKLIYLSCNPSTQARDIKLLTDGGYRLDGVKGYNFFPRTPHIESLAVLEYSV